MGKEAFIGDTNQRDRSAAVTDIGSVESESLISSFRSVSLNAYKKWMRGRKDDGSKSSLSSSSSDGGDGSILPIDLNVNVLHIIDKAPVGGAVHGREFHPLGFGKGHAASPPLVGQILEWKVTLWDGQNKEISLSWTKFAVGPEHPDDWKGGWIAHPTDMDIFDKSTEGGKMNKNDPCAGWKLRRPLPLFRAKVAIDKREEIASALLVVSGLGSFCANVNGVPLSTSGPIIRPLPTTTSE
eukprot:CCRYP_009075-RA/>CCRYP_009075-RA protein AED:0.42 eAED:0.42 QI:0/0/0/1/1/1/2/0/239